MSGKHTPGPWTVVRELRQEDECICDMLNCGWVIPRQGTKLANWDDDARLISAAPDLLDALECLKRELILSDVDMDYIESHFRPWINKAESAVAKAHGYLFSPTPDKARGAS